MSQIAKGMNLMSLIERELHRIERAMAIE